MEKLQTQERSQVWKLCVALAPVALFAPFVAFTRYLDHSHHWEGTLVLTTTVFFFQFDASTQMTIEQ